MPPEFVERTEFEGYSRRHEADAFAHSPMIERNSIAGSKVREAMEIRLTHLEAWQQRTTGALLLLAFLIGGGGVATVIELARK